MSEQFLKSNSHTNPVPPWIDGISNDEGLSRTATLHKSDSGSSWNQLSSIGGGLELTSDFNDVYRKAKNLRDVTDSHFNEWDQDGNDVLSLTEIQVAKENTSERATLARLSILEDGYQTLSAVNDDSKHSSGISKADLDLSLSFLEPGRTNYNLPERLVRSFGTTIGAGLLANQLFSICTRATTASAGMYSIAISRYPTASLVVGVVAGLAAGVGLYLSATDESRRHLEESRDSIANLLRSATY